MRGTLQEKAWSSAYHVVPVTVLANESQAEKIYPNYTSMVPYKAPLVTPYLIAHCIARTEPRNLELSIASGAAVFLANDNAYSYSFKEGNN